MLKSSLSTKVCFVSFRYELGRSQTEVRSLCCDQSNAFKHSGIFIGPCNLMSWDTETQRHLAEFISRPWTGTMCGYPRTLAVSSSTSELCIIIHLSRYQFTDVRRYQPTWLGRPRLVWITKYLRYILLCLMTCDMRTEALFVFHAAPWPESFIILCQGWYYSSQLLKVIPWYLLPQF